MERLTIPNGENIYGLTLPLLSLLLSLQHRHASTSWETALHLLPLEEVWYDTTRR
jgi:hypothetical protein